jgi:hypothetical protein
MILTIVSSTSRGTGLPRLTRYLLLSTRTHFISRSSGKQECQSMRILYDKFFNGDRTIFLPPVNRFHKRVRPESVRSFPRLEPLLLIFDEVAKTDQFIPFQTPKALRMAGFRGGLGCVCSRRRIDHAPVSVYYVFLGGVHVQPYLLPYRGFQFLSMTDRQKSAGPKSMPITLAIKSLV